MPDQLSRLAAALAGRYLVERELGQGGMASVYLARDRIHDRPVAIKVLRPELNVAFGADRFLREIALLSRLTHPNILPIHDSGESDGLLYYVMPYIAGESLRDRLKRESHFRDMVSFLYFNGIKVKDNRSPGTSGITFDAPTATFHQDNAYTDNPLHGLFKFADDRVVSPNMFLSAKYAYYNTGFVLTPEGGMDLSSGRDLRARGRTARRCRARTSGRR